MKRFSWFEVGLISFIAVFTTACLTDDFISAEEQLEIDLENVDKEQLEIDVGIIDTFLNENGIVAEVHSSGLRYVIHEEGEGPSPQLLDVIRVGYRGSLLEETEAFDENEDIRFPLNDLILGWKVGFQLLQVGDSATFYIPSGLGYGETGNLQGGIPEDANLTFEVKLIDVERF